MGFKEWIIPQDKIFFNLLEKQATVVKKAAEFLVECVEDFTDVKNKCHRMKQMEHEGDKITHQMYEYLNKNFITPLEPEEISKLASALDDILDLINGTVQQMYVYGIEDTDSHMIELSKLILLSTMEIDEGIGLVRNMKDPSDIERTCIEINRLENLADDILGDSMRELFRRDDAIMIIKLKDIYENLERATDKCEDVANVLGDIAIRHT